MENKEQSAVSGSTFQWTLVRFIVDPLVPCATLNGDPHLWIQVNINETIGDFIKNLKAILGIQIEIGLYCQGYNLPAFSPGTWFTTLPEPIVILPAGSSNYAIEHYGTARVTTIQPINFHVSPPPALNATAFETPVERDVAKSLPIALFGNKGNKTDTPIAETKNTVDETDTQSSNEPLLMTPHRVLGVSAEFNSVNTAPPAIVTDTANAEKTSVLRNVGSSSSPSVEVTKSSGRGKKRNSAPSRLKAVTRINSPLRDGNSGRGTPARRSQRIQRFCLPKVSSPASGLIDSPVILKGKKRKHNDQDQDENIPSNNEKRRKSKTSQYYESGDSMAESDFSDEAPKKANKRKTKAKGNRRGRQKRSSPATTTDYFPSPMMTKPCSVTIEKLETSVDLEVKNNSIVSSTVSLKTSSKQKNIFSDAFLQTSHEGMNDPVAASFGKIASKNSEAGNELSSLNVAKSALPSIPAELLSVADIQNMPPKGPHALDSMAEFLVAKEIQISEPSLRLLPASEPAQDYGEYENSNSGYSPCAVFDFNELISTQIQPRRNNDESCCLSPIVCSTNGTALLDKDDPMRF